MRREDLRQYLEHDPTGTQRHGVAELLLAVLESRVHIVTTLTSPGHNAEKWDVHIVIDDPLPAPYIDDEEPE